MEYHTLTLVVGGNVMASAHKCAIIITFLRICANESTAFVIISSKGKIQAQSSCYEHNKMTGQEIVGSLIET